VTKVEFYRDGTVFSTLTTAPWTAAWNITSTDNGTHTFIAKAYDLATNNQTSIPISISVNIPVPDTTPPTAPSNLIGTVSGSSIVISWNPSSDNVGVTNYRIYRNNVLYSALPATSYTDTAVTAGVTYSYYITALDAAGNVSSQSNTVSVTVPASQLPSITNYQVSVKTGTTATVTWTTDVPTTGTISYGTTSSLGLSLSDSISATSHTLTLKNLTKNTKYYYKITATAPGGSTSSTISTFRTSAK
jgi:fibronectin type 3 domain-containing protein